MSGDVQPRKRKDKKKKKDEFTGLAPPAEERPAQVRAPSSSHASPEGAVIMHAQHDHGTGGHWCAKIIFFILLGILIGLIGLIILENRGLSDLETPNSESRYAAVFDGWVDEALPDDHHHDEHTFELTHPDDDDDHDNADKAQGVSEEQDSEEQQDDQSEEKDEDSNDEEDDENSEEPDNEDNEEDADEDSEREEEDYSEEDNNEASEEDRDDDASEELQEDDSAEQADDQSQEQVDENSDEQDDDEDDASNEGDSEAKNEQDNADNNEQDNDESNEEDDEASDEQNDNNSAEQNEDNSAEENDDNSDEASEGYYLKDESKEQDGDNDDSNQDNEEQDGGDLSDQENDVELEDIMKETDTQAASEGSKEKDVSDNEGENESEIDEIQDDFSDIEEEISDYAKGDFQEEFLEDEVEQEGGETAHGDDKPYEELDSAEEVVVDNAAGEQEYEERKAKEQQAAEEETSNLGVKFGVGVALVAVAHAVLVRKWRNAREQAATGDRSERRLTLMEDSLLLGTDGKLSPKETSGKRVFFSPTTTEHEANAEESEVEEEEEEEQYNYEPPVKSASSFFTRSQPPIVHRAPEDEEDDEIMQVEEFSKKIGFAETQSAPLIAPPKNLPVEKNEEIELSEDEISEDEMPGDVEVISDDEVNENIEAEKPEEDEPVAEEEDAAEEDVVEEEEDEVEDVEDEEDISDVDDVELMKRLEMKYGKLPDEDGAQEPSRKRKPEGGLSVETWADEPADNQWRQQLDLAQAELDEGKVDEARDKYLRVLRVAPKSTRALWGYARCLDLMAERKRSNEILNAAIAAYNNLLNLGPALSDKLFRDVANRTINRIRFKGNALLAEPVHKLLVERFHAEPKYRNDLAISYLMTNNPHKARLVLQETLKRWPNDGVALVHYGFILKTVDSKLEEAVTYLQRGIDTGDEGTLDGRFFFQLGDALLMLGRKKEAHEVHKTGSLKGVFLSPEQRSLYNVDRLLGRPWWNVEQTPYSNLVNDLERHWREIFNEAVSMADEFGAEKEGLRSKGQWTQLELFTRGQEILGRCKKAPVTCAIIKKEAAAKSCRRGQIKFSALTPGTHIRPHVGPTNCRLRAHLGLTNTEGAYLRVHNETRTWHEGKVLIFDDSFEHEVWHNGTGTRVVLIVDLWHPELTPLERSTLPAI